MDWRILLIPLIPLAIWIIATIFRSLESKKDEEQFEPRRREAETPAPVAQRRQSASELDRFLQQAKQRRSGSRAHREAPPTPALSPLSEPRLEELPRARPAPPPTAATPVAVASAPVLMALPVPQQELLPSLPSPIAPPPPRWQPPAVLTRLSEMLADRDSLRAAIALQEILNRPVSQRR